MLENAIPSTPDLSTVQLPSVSSESSQRCLAISEALTCIPLTIVQIIIFGVILGLLDNATDIYTIYNYYHSSSSLMWNVASGLLASIILCSMIGTIHITRIIHNTNSADYIYTRIWGTKPRQIITMVFHVMGLGSVFLNVDLMIDIKNKVDPETLIRKEKVVIASELLRVILESLPQAIMQAGALLLELTSGTQQQCFYKEDDMIAWMRTDWVQNFVWGRPLTLLEQKIFYFYQLTQTSVNYTSSCTCQMTNELTTNPEIYCQWDIFDYFPYISVVTSTISLIWVFTHQGYIHFLNYPSSKDDLSKPSIALKVLVYIFSMISGIYGLSLGVYFMFTKSMSHSAFLLLLLPLLFIRICTPNNFSILLHYSFIDAGCLNLYPREISKSFLTILAFTSSTCFFRNFPYQTLKIRKVSLVVMGS
jgi:hypothetical protein